MQNGLIDMICKNGGAFFARAGIVQQPAQPGSEEDVVTQHQCRGLLADKIRADDEGLRQAFGSGLHGIVHRETEFAAVTK